MLNITCIPVGALWTNSYILWDAETREGVLVDPGDEGARLVDEVRKKKIDVRRIIITHGHFDHIKDAANVSAALKSTVLASRLELPFIEHVSEQAAMFGFPPARPVRVDAYLEDGDTVHVGPHAFQVLATPGHSPGSISLYCGAEGVVIAGDLIFFESIGRTDLPGGDYETLLRSIGERILTMPDDTKILSGHGEATTVGHERLYNPFLKGGYGHEA